MELFGFCNMWYQKTKNGKYQFIERYKIGGRYKTTSIVMPARTPKYKAKAQSILNERISGFKAYGKEMSDLTLNSLYEAYIAWEKANLKEQTARNNKRKLRKVIEALGKDTLVAEITPALYKKVMDEPATTYNERLTRFKAMMRWAYSEEYIRDISFIDRIKPKKDTPTRIKVQDKFLEREELQALVANAVPHWSHLIEFLALTGLRIGEAIDLKVEDVDLKNRTISVNSTFSTELGRSSSVKTETSEREIYIQDELMDVIKKIDIGKKYFFEVDGERIHYDAFRIYLNRLSEKVIGRKVSPHITRHTHTSLLAEAGIPLDQISRRLGHSDSRVTKQVYLHITERAKQTENKRLDLVHLL